MSMQIKIAPCPFCEGPPCVSAYDDMTREEVFIDRPQTEGFDESYEAHVWCHECGARGPFVDTCTLCIFERQINLTVADVMRIAVERWNERGNKSRSCYDAGDAGGLNLFPLEAV